jgi:hypothetical protein
LTVSGNTPAPASSVTVNGQPSVTYADFSFASSNGFTLNDGQNSFTNVAVNYYGTAVTNALTVNLPQGATLQYDANGNLTYDGNQWRGMSHPFEKQCRSSFTLLTCPVTMERSFHLSFRTFQHKGHPHPVLSRSTPRDFHLGLSPKISRSTELETRLPRLCGKAFQDEAGGTRIIHLHRASSLEP